MPPQPPSLKQEWPLKQLRGERGEGGEGGRKRGREGGRKRGRDEGRENDQCFFQGGTKDIFPSPPWKLFAPLGIQNLMN